MSEQISPSGDDRDRRPSSRSRRAQRPETEFSPAEHAVAKIVRRTYIEDRSAWERLQRGTDYEYRPSRLYDKGAPAHDLDGKPHKAVPSIWLSLARRFIVLELDPADYIHRLFEKKLVRGRAPEPAALLNREFLDYYRSESCHGDELEECRLSLLVQCRTAASNIAYWQSARMGFEQSHSTVLCDEALELSALFRFCLACKLMERGALFADIARQYEGEAAVQFQRSKKEYLESWGEWLPPDFAKRSRRIYLRSLYGDDWNEEDQT